METDQASASMVTRIAKRGRLALIFTILLLVLGTQAYLFGSGKKLVGIRNSLIAEVGVPGDFNWTPENPPADFLQEDIALYSDAQIGAAVRTVHSGCKKVLEEIFEIESIQKQDEGSSVTIEKDFDPSVVKLSGHVVGDPPFTGVLKHHGWRAEKSNFPEIPKGKDPTVIAPAEVEITKPPEDE